LSGTARTGGHIGKILTIVAACSTILGVSLRFFADSVASLPGLRANLRVAGLLAAIFDKNVRVGAEGTRPNA
jgi:hypothetical protein